MYNALQKQSTEGANLKRFNDHFALPGLANDILFTDFSASETILYVFSLL
jgi:hypothetical protein